MLSKKQIKDLETNGYLFLGRIITESTSKRIYKRLVDLTHGKIRNPKLTFQLEGQPVGFFDIPSDSYRKIQDLQFDDIIWNDLVCNTNALSILDQLIGEPLAIQRAQGLLKPAFDGSPLGWHQDAGIGFPTTTKPYYTIWTSFNDADENNGGLQIIPGSQLVGIPEIDIQQMIDNKLTKSEEYETHYKKLGERSRSLANIMPGKINLNAKAGESYLLNPLVIHGSLPNKSKNPRKSINVLYHSQLAEILGKGKLDKTLEEDRAKMIPR